MHKKFISGRKWVILGVLTSVTALASALFLQIFNEWFPCPLCIIQRYAYFGTALGFLMIGLTKPEGSLSVILTTLTLISLVFGAGIAFYQVWVLSNPMQTCGVDPLQNVLNALPWVSYWPDMFMSDGLCSDPYPPLLGLSLPMWSGLVFLLQGVLLWLAIQTRQRMRAW
jgi:disulfide bond formation protein DsbB